ncbi:hypothetical protein AMATHDRAFT_141215 [Amanita thiersii Skay4041]|uniref:NAD+ kinase n=1 Tax=Amanita thiersii Skay4041 TaxID=703135 RepID=A0A2A9NRP3_9AGAR|nr:hypothetical protein AMATHDRAFT_141215 [Amanita thiersii Skay4041]
MEPPQSRRSRPSSLHIRNPPPNIIPIPDPMPSPCFIHSHLDKVISLTEKLRSKHHVDSPGPELSKSLQYFPSPSSTSSTLSAIESDEDDEDEYVGSLTKQLAETAVGVREMSKQLGRARVHSNIQTVLVVTKARDNRLIKLTRQLAIYLMLKRRKGQKRGLIVYVDSQLRRSRRFDAAGIQRDHPELFIPIPHRKNSSSTSLNSLSSQSSPSSDPQNTCEEGQLRYWTSSMCSHSPHLFDFVITLGGDGTVLFTSWLFQRIVPPVLSFALGSLGFLTNFDFADHQAVMDAAIDTGIRVNLRMRFTCTVYRSVANRNSKQRTAVKKGDTGEILMKNVEKGGWEALEGGLTTTHSIDGKAISRDKEIMCYTTRPVETFEVLNDLVVDRGPSPYVSLLELFGDEHHMTTVQADGLTVSTPTGSTAYSLSAGGSLVHPEIPAILITPICPHTLSFRPMLLPDSMELRICVPYNSRSTAWASFDGRGRIELQQGDHIKITASKYPFPTVCADKQSTDWFHAISRTLKWNERERQKSFVVVEEDITEPNLRRRSAAAAAEKHKSTPSEVRLDEDEEEDEVTDEEDGFDIDDSTGDDTATSNIETKAEIARGQEKTLEEFLEVPSERFGTRKDHARRRISRSRSRTRPARRVAHSPSSSEQSGVETPGRYAGPYPYPPIIHHVNFDVPDSKQEAMEVNGSTDKQFSTRPSHGDRESELDAARTPTVTNQAYNKLYVQPRTRLQDHNGHRAFAVWGQDESDSAASDNSDT